MTNRLINISFLILLVAFMMFPESHAQKVKEQAPPIKDRLFFGGHFGLQFGTITDIQVSPVIGLWVLPRLNVAVGPTYRYYKYRLNKTHIYGGKAFTELVVLRNINSVIPIGSNTSIIAHFEDELLSLDSFFRPQSASTDRFLLNTVLAGGGISQQMGKKSSLNFLFLWALNDSGYGVYNNPEIRILLLF